MFSENEAGRFLQELSPSVSQSSSKRETDC